jgi:hypothetical protein
MTKTSANANAATALPERTLAVFVHRNYYDRVVDYFYPSVSSADSSAKSSARSAVQVLDAQVKLGVSHTRRGYLLVLCPEVQQVPTRETLSPLARQNISWTARLQWTTCVVAATDNNNKDSNSVSLAPLVARLWESLLLEKEPASSTSSLDLAQDILRINVYPRQCLEPVCGLLQKAAAAHVCKSRSDDENPFDGPLRMTASLSNCTIRLTVVITQPPKHEAAGATNTATEEEDSTSYQRCYWGIDARPADSEAMNLPLNHDAHGELAIVPMQTNGKEATPAPAVTVPLSRAYYKLHQVWQQVLHPRRVELNLQEGAGLDLGSSPGGWTQVLVHSLQLPLVYTLDPAVVADRVTQCGRVTHVQQRMEDWEGTDEALSILVCDASLLWSELLDQVASVLAKCRRWCFPAVLVLTLKLPFRNPGSVQRHVGEIESKIPKFVKEWATMISARPLETECQLLHLFANSASERTAVVIFRSPEGST